MESQLVKLETGKEEAIKLDDAIKGCDSAIITYGVDTNYNIHKITSVFTRNQLSISEYEELGIAHREALVLNPKMALIKEIHYKIQDGNLIKCSRDYTATLIRTLPGYVVSGNVVDVRNKYEQSYK